VTPRRHFLSFLSENRFVRLPDNGKFSGLAG